MTDRELPRTKADYTYAVKTRVDDPQLLLPAFQPIVGRIFWRMVELGFEPVIFDTLRTQAEADKNAANKKGSKNSLHLFGAAVDLTCARHGWLCHTQECAFYTTLRKLYLRHCYIGPAGDYPHGQAIPVSQQALFRGLPESQRNAFVKVWLLKRG